MTRTPGSVTGVAAFGIFAAPTATWAHSPIEGIGTFYGHMLHPVTVPAHALLLIGITLMLGQQPRLEALLGLVSFGLAFAFGLTLSGLGYIAEVREQLLLGGALLAGGLVCLNRPLPTGAVSAGAIVAGLALGVDSSPDIAGYNQLLLAYSGLLVGLFAIAVIVTGSTVGLATAWQRIGIRVAGSWIMAVSVLALALSVSSRSTVAMPG
jgi:urease accessory protein